MLRDEEWKEVDGIIYKEEKVYILKDEQLKQKLFGYITTYQLEDIENNRR